MLILELLGLAWLACMALRLRSLWYELGVLRQLFRKKYTRLQTEYVLVRWVLVPGLLIAPAMLWVEGRAFFTHPSVEELQQVAVHLDQSLQRRAAGAAQ